MKISFFDVILQKEYKNFICTQWSYSYFFTNSINFLIFFISILDLIDYAYFFINYV